MIEKDTKIIEDLLKWKSDILKETGEEPKEIYMSKALYTQMITEIKIDHALDEVWGIKIRIV